jgi:hypothetical protein
LQQQFGVDAADLLVQAIDRRLKQDRSAQTP